MSALVQILPILFVNVKSIPKYSPSCVQSADTNQILKHTFEMNIVKPSYKSERKGFHKHFLAFTKAPSSPITISTCESNSQR